jgi:hypothetical protein
MKNLLTTLAFVSVVLITGCQKDDFKEVIGVCPVVLSTSPEDGATGVALDKIITVSFNQRMNPATITSTSLLLRGPGTTTVAGTITYLDSTASFRPSSALAPNTTYTGTVTTLVKDLPGNALQTNYVWSFVTGPTGVEFNTVARFGVFAATNITNIGFSEVRNMDVGLSPGLRALIIGFPPGIVINGGIYAADDLLPTGVAAMLTASRADLATAYLSAESASSPASVILTGDQGGRTLTPGIYKSTTALTVQAGNLTLNARGDANAVWIFQIADNLTTSAGTGGNIILTGGAQAKNVYWQTGGSATIGAGTSFNGNILALNSIALNSGATVVGRLLARTGSISMNTNIINKP